jgi:hypothetical protein
MSYAQGTRDKASFVEMSDGSRHAAPANVEPGCDFVLFGTAAVQFNDLGFQ